MARRVFFSFHYDEDIWRVNQIRNMGVTRDWEALPFLDAASWEAVKRKGDAAVQGWIDRQLDGTGVTVVLIGSQTASRKYVKYEIQESHRRGKPTTVISDWLFNGRHARSLQPHISSAICRQIRTAIISFSDHRIRHSRDSSLHRQIAQLWLIDKSAAEKTPSSGSITGMILGGSSFMHLEATLLRLVV